MGKRQTTTTTTLHLLLSLVRCADAAASTLLLGLGASSGLSDLPFTKLFDGGQPPGVVEPIIYRPDF